MPISVGAACATPSSTLHLAEKGQVDQGARAHRPFSSSIGLDHSLELLDQPTCHSKGGSQRLRLRITY